MILDIPDETLFEILDNLRLTPVYALLGSEFQEELGEDFKPHKWLGYERNHADQAVRLYKQLLDLAAEAAK